MDVLSEMIRDRGWTAVDLFPLQDPPPNEHDLYGVFDTGEGEPAPRAVVLNFDNDKRVGNIAIKDVRLWYNWMKAVDIRSMVLISREKLNFFIVKEVTALDGVTVNMLTSAQLQVNPTKSVYYVPHTRLDAAHAQQLKRKYNSALPTIPVTDPVVLYFGWNVGDVIKVRRNYGGFEFHDTYRVVTS
jgi:DNA-directed RNA polymerase subunit H (RpoH/RPB5)